MKRSGRSTHLVGVVLSGAVLIAACGSASSPLASSGAASAILNVAASPSARADADASASPTANSNAASWASPKANATVRTYKVNLSATASGPVARIEFSVASSGKLKTACLARKPDAAGNWTCTADLLRLGVMPGKLSFCSM